MKLLCLILATLATPSSATDYITFLTPSRNIACLMSSGTYNTARCEMREWTPSHTEPPADCDLDWGGSYEVASLGEGQLSCAGDTIMMDFGPILQYGEQITVEAITCLSERTGLTCTNTAGHGFTLSRARQRLF